MKLNFSKSRLLLPRYIDLLDKEYHIALVWGGRDSGKTFCLQLVLLVLLLIEKHKAVFARKIKDTVKDSMFAGFKSKFEAMGIANLIRSTNSPLESKIINGSQVLCRGFDDPMKIKGIEQPTIGWIEEADQCTSDDFDMLYSTIRHPTKKTKIFLSFNPEVDRNGKNWIVDRFIGDNPEPYYGCNKIIEKEFKFINKYGKEEKDVIRILSIHTNYKDNKYCTPHRRAMLEGLKEIDFNKWNVWANGRLGQREVKKPFFPAFSKDMIKKHTFDPSLKTVISFDFNVAPCTATISQETRHSKRFWREIRLGTSDNKADIYKVCDAIKEILPVFYITKIRVRGDASGSNASAYSRGSLSAYQIIQKELNLSIDNFEVPTFNINHENSYMICNEILRKKEVTFDPEMEHTIIDLTYLEYENGKILKKEAEKVGRGHLADCVRYDLHAIYE